MKRLTILLATGMLLSLASAFAAVPQSMNFQGILRDGSGNPVANGPYQVVFRIYDAASGGSLLWNETQIVTTTSGLFTALLGAATPVPASAFDDSSRYLGITVGADPEMTPRQKLVSVGFTFRTEQWTSTAGDLIRTTGNVGIGATPGFQTKLDVQTSGSNSFIPMKGIQGIADNTSSGAAEGGYFAAGPNGTGSHYGVYATGTGSPTSATPFGIYGRAVGSGFGYASIGCFGEAENSGDAIGGDFFADAIGSGSHMGVRGTANSSSGSEAALGVFGRATNTSSGSPIGVSGSGFANTGTAYGGSFYGSSTSGTSYGVSGTGDNYGVHGNSTNIGVYGTSGSYAGGYFVGGSHGAIGSGGNYGLYGSAGISGGAGVWGYNQGNIFTYGVYSAGDARVSRNLTVDGDSYMTGFIFKIGGGFRIDHPTDPANKYLYHSFVESPDMTNLYNGNITLDAKGEATVQLPDWFGALNKDFRYQLTAIGAPGPDLYIAQKVVGNQFRIAGGTPGMEVSWQVTGIRQDAYASAHRIPVELDKSATERGKYLHPKEQGMPETLGMNYEESHRMEIEYKRIAEEGRVQEAQRAKEEQERARIGQTGGGD